MYIHLRPDLFYYLFLELFLSDIWRGGWGKKNKTLFPHFSKVSSSVWIGLDLEDEKKNF
jgi:hypothetical protein